MGEWFYGKHDFGFFTPGALFHPARDHVIVIAYKIPNHPANGKSGLVFEYGFFFGGGKNGGHHRDDDGPGHQSPKPDSKSSDSNKPDSKPAPKPDAAPPPETVVQRALKRALRSGILE